MKTQNAILLALFSIATGIFTGIKLKSNTDSQKQQTSVKEATTHQIPKVNPLQWATDTTPAVYTVIRSAENSDVYLYSVILNEDQESYDFLNQAELDTVLSGRYLSNEKRLTGE